MIPLMKGNIRDLINGKNKDNTNNNGVCDVKKTKGKKYCSVGDEFDE